MWVSKEKYEQQEKLIKDLKSHVESGVKRIEELEDRLDKKSTHINASIPDRCVLKLSSDSGKDILRIFNSEGEEIFTVDCIENTCSWNPSEIKDLP